MKKFFAILAIAGVLTACNNESETTNNAQDSLDSANKANKEMMDSSNSATKNAMDSTTSAKKDSLSAMDSTKNAMADSLKK